MKYWCPTPREGLTKYSFSLNCTTFPVDFPIGELVFKKNWTVQTLTVAIEEFGVPISNGVTSTIRY